MSGEVTTTKIERTATALVLPEGLSFEKWKAEGERLATFESGIQWWIGDWWLFGDRYNRDRVAMVESDDWKGLGHGACRNAAVVAAAFNVSRRRDTLTFSHHAELAALDAATADALLDRAEEGKTVAGKQVPLSTRELRALVARHRQAAIEPPALPAGKYGTIVVDPPWAMEKIEREVRPNQKGFDYTTMNWDELVAFGVNVKMLAADDCHLFMWTTQKFLEMGLRLMPEWGFRHVLTMVWHKPGGFQPIGLPQYNCEFALYGRKGSPKFVDTKDFNCCFEAPRREHSRKPKEFYETIRRVTADGRVDVFARERHEGFTPWGNEVDKFVEAA